MSIRPVKRLSKSKPTLEGAGVHLRRAFGPPVLGLVAALPQRPQDQLRIVLGVLEKQNVERAVHVAGRGSGGDSLSTSQ